MAGATEKCKVAAFVGAALVEWGDVIHLCSSTSAVLADTHVLLDYPIARALPCVAAASTLLVAPLSLGLTSGALAVVATTPCSYEGAAV